MGTALHKIKQIDIRHSWRSINEVTNCLKPAGISVAFIPIS